MMKTRDAENNIRLYAAVAFLASALLFVTRFAAGVDFWSYPYSSYLLQAQAWLRGETALAHNYEYLELAIFNGRYYVSFPPVPSIPMVLWTLIFGDKVPGGFFQKLYALIACLLVLSELRREETLSDKQCGEWAVFLCFSSALLPITVVGGVWYEAQILSFLFCIAAVIAIRRDQTTWGCIAYALSVGCRPMTVCLGPALLVMVLMRHRGRERTDAVRGLLPGILCGLAIAAAYGWYNYIRFGDPLEFGHNYLPEFQMAENGQFSTVYLWQNFKDTFFTPPIRFDGKDPAFSRFGFSMFISCPILLLQSVWVVTDILHRRMNAVKWTLLLCGSLNLFFILLHRTIGGFQFGLRYAIELIPYAFAWLLEDARRQELRSPERYVLIGGLVLNIIGGICVHV